MTLWGTASAGIATASSAAEGVKRRVYAEIAWDYKWNFDYDERDDLGAFSFVHTPHGTYPHRFQRLVIELAAVIVSHATREPPARLPVNKNVNLFMDRLIVCLP